MLKTGGRCCISKVQYVTFCQWDLRAKALKTSWHQILNIEISCLPCKPDSHLEYKKSWVQSPVHWRKDYNPFWFLIDLLLDQHHSFKVEVIICLIMFIQSITSLTWIWTGNDQQLSRNFRNLHQIIEVKLATSRYQGPRAWYCNIWMLSARPSTGRKSQLSWNFDMLVAELYRISIGTISSH